MKKKLFIVFAIIVVICGLFIGGYLGYRHYQVKNALKIVKIKTKEVDVYSDIRLADLIESLNGKLIDNPRIDTSKLGQKAINFSYINDDNIKVDYTFSIDIVDKTPPIISQIEVYNVDLFYEGDLSKKLFCGDNYDPNPVCRVVGNYDLNKVGKYNVSFVAEDSSHNIASHDFILNVQEKSKGIASKTSTTDFSSVVDNYKNANTKIGIDISHWQGDIDFNEVKKAGVEFAYIRVGRGSGIGGGYVLDSKFIQNIEGFNAVDIPVGVYFYSYANSYSDAINEAKWVLKQIKKYDVQLEIVFDWENWSLFQDFDLSFYNLTKMAEAFILEVESNGYEGMLYSSKNYLENIWYPISHPIFLAHYTKKTDYEGKYKVWQICNNGKVSGIDDNVVDIDIRYE